MLTVVVSSFVGVQSFDKSSSSSPLMFPVNTLLLTCSPLLTCLISTQLLCHFLSRLLGILESSYYFLPYPTVVAIEFFIITPNLSDPWKMKQCVGFMYYQIFLHVSHIVVVRNNFYEYPITSKQLKIRYLKMSFVQTERKYIVLVILLFVLMLLLLNCRKAVRTFMLVILLVKNKKK